MMEGWCVRGRFFVIDLWQTLKLEENQSYQQTAKVRKVPQRMDL